MASLNSSWIRTNGYITQTTNYKIVTSEFCGVLKQNKVNLTHLVIYVIVTLHN